MTIAPTTTDAPATNDVPTTNAAPTTFLPPGTFESRLIADAVSPAWCAALLASIDHRGIASTSRQYPPGYRDNDRLAMNHPDLAYELFTVLGAQLPQELTVDGERWELCGLNNIFRLCRYRDGQAFSIHRDGPHVPADDVRSHLTVQLYLDDDPGRVGGHTRFYADAHGDTRWASIAPACGTAIVFDHRVWHDGEAVTAGVKHVLRTDAMYRRVAVAAPTARRADTPRTTEASAPNSNPTSTRNTASDAPASGRNSDSDARTTNAPDASRAAIIGRHRGYVWRAIACRTGIASVGRDGLLRRWSGDAHDPRFDGAARGGGRDVDVRLDSLTAIAEAPDGALWIGTRRGDLVVVRDDDYDVAFINGAAILSLVARADGIVTADADGIIRAFTPDGAPRWATHYEHPGQRAHMGWAWCVIEHGDGVLSCGADGRIVRTDASGTRELAALREPLRALVSTPSGLVAGDTRGWLHYLTLRGEVIGSTRAHAAAITSLAACGDELASASEDGTVTRWRDRQPLDTTHHPDFVTSVAYADGALITACYDGAIRRC